jgi:hypothetical protein
VVAWFSDAETRQDPWAFYDRLREEDPVHRCDALNTWVVTRYDDGDEVFRGSPVVRTPAGSDMSYMYGEDGELRPTWKLDRGTHRWHEGEDLARIRRLVTQVMNPRSIRSWRDQMESILEEKVAALRSRNEMDLIADFVYELPMRMICDVFGVPLAHHEDYKRWAEQWFAGVVFVTDEEVQRTADAAAEAYAAHVMELVEFKRDNPDESLLSLLIRARDEGDKLSDDELVSMTTSMIAAGHETTGSQVGNAVLALLRNPDQLALLRENPDLVVDAMEEALRYEPSAMLTPRYAVEEFELRGRTIREGDAIQVILQATGRTPDIFPEPERYSIEREDKRHLAFALGPHFCCGAQLARLEGQLMLRAVATEFPGMRLETDTFVYKPILGIRGLESLPVSWN